MDSQHSTFQMEALHQGWILMCDQDLFDLGCFSKAAVDITAECKVIEHTILYAEDWRIAVK